MSDLQAIEEWAGALLQQLSPAQRITAARKVGQALRRSQSKRIAAQRAPDGSAYAPRSVATGRLRQKAGTIKRRTMFARLRTTRFLKVEASAQEIGVGFMGRAASIARTHQDGAKRRSRRSGITYTTPKRELLGFSADDIQHLRDSLLDHLAGK